LNPPESQGARAIAQRLIRRGRPDTATSSATAARVEDVLAQAFRNLSEWVGSAGCHALFARAITLSAPEHPVLKGVSQQLHPSPHLDHFAENAGEHGSEATREAATAVLASIIATLSDLIGEDIVLSLLEDSHSPAPKHNSPAVTPTAQTIAHSASSKGQGSAGS
jgi:hypothetical protein